MMTVNEETTTMTTPVEEVDDVFTYRKRKKVSRQKPLKRIKINLQLPSVVVRTAAAVNQQEQQEPNATLWHEFASSTDDTFDFDFYADTHERQDPEYHAFHEGLQRDYRRHALQALEAADKRRRVEIQSVIDQLLREKQSYVDQAVEKYKLRLAAEEKIAIQRRQHVYRSQAEADTTKINESIHNLKRRHHSELQQKLAAHQQQARQRRIPDAHIAAAANQIKSQTQAMHTQMVNEYKAKGEEINGRAKMDFQRDVERIRKQSVAKLDEYKHKVRSSLYMQLRQRQQRYNRRNMQNMLRERERILSSDPKRNENTNARKSSSREESSALDQAAPIKSTQPWMEAIETLSGASTRHKNRKAVMSQAERNTGLLIEIHNEGILRSSMASMTDSKEDKTTTTKTRHEEFIPWGASAFSVLSAVLTGEIPAESERFTDRDERSAENILLQSGQVRCTIYDMRTSEATAVEQRARAAREHQQSILTDLETRALQLGRRAGEIENEAKRLSTLEKKQTNAIMVGEENVKAMIRRQDDTKKQYIGPDGKSTLDPAKQQQLDKHLQAYKSKIDGKSREIKMLKQALAETKLKYQKLQVEHQTMSKEYNTASALVKKSRALEANRTDKTKDMKVEFERATDFIRTMKRVAGYRRAQFEKRNKADFLQPLNLPNSLRQSLNQKIHRRRHNIMLRPVHENYVGDLSTAIARFVGPKFSNRSGNGKIERIEAEILEGESTLLTMLYPFSESRLSPSPPSKSSNLASGPEWAEPGWMVDLAVDDDLHDPSMILPRRKTYLVEKNLAELASTPGRQVASFIGSGQLRSLEVPLTSLATATAPAETNVSVDVSARTKMIDDPLYLSPEDMADSYRFSLKPTSRQSSQTRKRSSPAKVQDNASESSTANKRESTSKQAASPTKVQTEAATGDKRRASVKKTMSPPKTSSPRAQRPVARVDPMQVTQQQTAVAAAMPPTGYASPRQQRPHVQPHQGIPQQHFTPQMAQLRMMQQQQQATSPRHQHPNFPPQALQQMPQFYNPMSHQQAVHMRMHAAAAAAAASRSGATQAQLQHRSMQGASTMPQHPLQQQQQHPSSQQQMQRGPSNGQNDQVYNNMR